MLQYQVIDELPSQGDSPNAADSSVPNPAVNVTDINDTLTALEEHKQKLLAELDEMGSITSSTPAQSAAAMSYTSGSKPPVLDLEQGEEVEEVSQNIPQQGTPPPSHQSMSYLECTPVIQHSGIDKLPSFDKFSDGMTDHLPYENLPNATGVYEKMSGLLKDVKDKMSSIHPKRRAKK